MAVAHASEMAVLEVPHVVSMHWPAIPSILGRLESNRWAEGRPELMPKADANNAATRKRQKDQREYQKKIADGNW
jgi:hypothetical protein